MRATCQRLRDGGFRIQDADAHLKRLGIQGWFSKRGSYRQIVGAGWQPRFIAGGICINSYYPGILPHPVVRCTLGARLGGRTSDWL